MQRTPLKNYHYEKLKEYNINPEETEGFICFQYEKGETVLMEGMTMDYLYIVMKGKAKVCVSTEYGRDLLLSWYVEEGVIGDVELMSNGFLASTSVTTLSEFECIGIPYQSYGNALRQNTVFLNKIGLELSKKLIKTTMNCKSAALYSAETRLCICLLEASDGDMIRIPLTELASAAGTSYRHMQRIMRQLCNSNILRKNKNGYQILDRSYILEKSPKNYMNG